MESTKVFFFGTRWSIVKKPARNCTGLPTRKCARSCRSRERNKRRKQKTCGCSRAKVPLDQNLSHQAGRVKVLRAKA